MRQLFFVNKLNGAHCVVFIREEASLIIIDEQGQVYHLAWGYDDLVVGVIRLKRFAVLHKIVLVVCWNRANVWSIRCVIIHVKIGVNQMSFTRLQGSAQKNSSRIFILIDRRKVLVYIAERASLVLCTVSLKYIALKLNVAFLVVSLSQWKPLIASVKDYAGIAVSPICDRR